MKSTTLLFVACLLGMQSLFAGGLLTNANQSAQYIRMLSRNASTDLDAVYFNPAGVMEMQNGFHFGFHSQTLYQTRTITTTAPLNNQEFIGELEVPVFPSAFAVYKKDKLAFSLGFGPNAGGGSVVFDEGIPSFEGRIAQMATGYGMLADVFSAASGGQILGVTGYNSDIAFEGQSVFWGFQLGMSTKVNEMVSVYGGVRVLPSVNTYSGTIANIQAITAAGAMPASQYQGMVKPVLDGLIGTLNTTQNNLKTAIGVGALDGDAAIEDPQLLQVLGMLGSDASTYGEAVGVLEATEGQLAQLNNSNLLDQELDTKQKGTGFTPIFGVNISPNDRLNIGAKYEFQTVLKLTNETKVDDTGLFPDKAETRTDIPAILMVGLDYKLTSKLSSSVSFNNYFDKGVNWGRTMSGDERVIEDNLWEVSLGLQYDFSDRFALSAGAMQSTTGVSEQYQSDFSYSNSSNSFAAGLQWKATKQLTLDAGVLYTTYTDEDKAFPTYTETYDKENIAVAIGLQYSLFK
ncbi:outer membrane protein transport protein [uncultured Sunxiuqinia sp.]|uniref:OmpP1/FadL family transporter n=1 Tax=uncultured Sunxiuqinia sp. TaxID=1573825 RepID=UPI0026163EA0|nr:outer membrane protein transport protein [uncultured Sunxiuqinia sp.]